MKPDTYISLSHSLKCIYGIVCRQTIVWKAMNVVTSAQRYQFALLDELYCVAECVPTIIWLTSNAKYNSAKENRNRRPNAIYCSPLVCRWRATSNIRDSQNAQHSLRQLEHEHTNSLKLFLYGVSYWRAHSTGQSATQMLGKWFISLQPFGHSASKCVPDCYALQVDGTVRVRWPTALVWLTQISRKMYQRISVMKFYRCRTIRSSTPRRKSHSWPD